MKQFISPHMLAALPPTSGVLLALSGGADSRALLHLLAADAKKHGYPLHICHVHHGIRAGEADRDEQRCRDLAAVYDCPVHVLHADVPALAKQSGESTEMVGRRVRYDYFSTLMREYSLPLLATAHHADDHAETLLMRLLVGTSTTGLGGISPVQPFADGYLVRPMLHTTRAEILAYCEKHALAYVTDSTNADTAYLRNHIRAALMPAIEQMVPHPQTQLLRTGQLLREDDELLQTLAAQAFADAITPTGALRLDALRQAPLPLQRRMLLLWIRQSKEDVRIDFCHVQALLALIETGHGMADLPGNLRAKVDGHRLCLTEKSAARTELPPLHLPLTEGRHELPLHGVTLTVERWIEDDEPTPQAQKIRQHPHNLDNSFIRDTRILDILSDGAYFRLREDGDVLLWHGMHRPVRKLQNERAIPPDLRCRVPLLCDDEGILWVPLVGTRDVPITNAATRYRITIEIQR